jgi:hypothetical protein
MDQVVAMTHDLIFLAYFTLKQVINSDSWLARPFTSRAVSASTSEAEALC